MTTGEQTQLSVTMSHRRGHRKFGALKIQPRPDRNRWAWQHEPTDRSNDPRCDVPGCGAPADFAYVRWGRRALPCFKCDQHRHELVKLLRAQGKDWGTTARQAGEVRFYYSSKRGFHGF
jgi:hypothetical protein